MVCALKLAAVYNLVWGGFVILFPLALFRWVGLDPLPSYPETWQCVGMIVGVYGVGYWIAASNIPRHWPIILVGFLGKIFGPIGFAKAVYTERFPLAMSWTIVTNDLIWWVPFGMMLWHAAVVNQMQTQAFRLIPPRRAIDPLGRILSQMGSSLLELSRRRPLLVVFLRHSGCTFCREALGDLAERRAEIEAQGTSIALVHMGVSEPKELLEKYGLMDVHCFRDPGCVLYDTFGLQNGNFRQLFGLRVILRSFRTLIKHGTGAVVGNGLRMPGVFLLCGGTILRSYRHDSAADRPDYVKLGQVPEGAEDCNYDTEEISAAV